jgi:hypothetical protein
MEIGVYGKALLLVVSTVLTAWALWKFRKCDHDKIMIAALILFQISFFSEVTVNLLHQFKILDFS